MAKFETHLSLSSLDEMIKRYENRKKDYPKIATNIANRLANEMLEDVKQATSPHNKKPYKDTELIPATIEGNIATAGIKNTTDKAYFNEFGTGIVGSQNPHIAEELAKEGYKEITLLGQNVNSYNGGENYKFANLLNDVCKIAGIERIRFVSPHPKDFTDDVIEAIANNEKVARVIHLPLQSGSSNILKVMNRKYTKEDYLKLVEKLKKSE